MLLQPVACLFQTCNCAMSLLTTAIILFKKGIYSSRRDIDKVEKVKALREASKRVTLGPDTLPSICCYTMMNCNEL